MMGNGFGTGMGWMWVFWLLLVAGVVLVIVVVVRAVGGGGARSDAGTSRVGDGRPGRGRAREVLDERYARGELATEEYRERLTALRDD